MTEYRTYVCPPQARLDQFGLTAEDHLELWIAQDGRCYICEKAFNTGRPACIDHDHRTYEVRGLLCSPCNQELGYRHDKARWFERAGLYLKHTPASRLWSTARRLRDAPPIPEKR